MEFSITEEKRTTYLILFCVQPFVGASLLLNAFRDDGPDVLRLVLGCACIAVGLVGGALWVVLRRRRRQEQ